MRRAIILAAIAVSLVFCADQPTNATEGVRVKKPIEAGRKLDVFVNKINPFDNPSETYTYYKLPFCKPKNIQEQDETLGELLAGDRPYNTPYEIYFKKNLTNVTICPDMTLNYNDVVTFSAAIALDYMFEMHVDDLVLHDFIGSRDENSMLLKNHYHFMIGVNQDDEIMYVIIQHDESRMLNLSDVTPGESIKPNFSYSVTFFPEEEITQYDERNINEDVFSEPISEEDQNVQWIAIANSFILVFVLVAFVTLIILRIVRKDLDRGIDREAQEDTSWKLLKKEVFTIPAQRNMLCAMTGAGMQLFFMAMIIDVFGLLGVYYGTEGGVRAAAVVLYSLTAVIGGYISGKTYKYLNGPKWAFNIINASLVYAVPVVAVWFVLNNIAWAYGSTAALPFTTICFLIFLWALVTFPLTVIGGLIARARFRENSLELTKPGAIMKVIPPSPWFKSTFVRFLFAGLIPFSAVYLELYYIFDSVWGHTTYHLFGMIFLAFFIYTLVVMSITVALIYFHLNTLDYNWWWASFFYGGASALFVFLYSIYYFFSNSHMFGVLQTTFYFGYSFVFSLTIFLMMGSVGFLSSLRFVRYIFSVVKLD